MTTGGEKRGFKYPEDESELPHMLKPGHVRRYLGKVSLSGEVEPLSRKNLYDLKPHLFYLDLPHDATAFPLPYIHALRNAINAAAVDQAETRLLSPARRFATTKEAHDIIRTEEDSLQQRLDEVSHGQNTEGLISVSDMGDILNLSNPTFTNWRKWHVPGIVQIERRMYFARDAFALTCPWQYPETYDPTVFEPTVPRGTQPPES